MSGQSSCAVIVLISLCGLRRILWVLSPRHTMALRPMLCFFSWSDARQTEPFTCCLTQSYLTPLYSVSNKKVLNGKKRQNIQLDLPSIQSFDTYLTVYDFFSWNILCILWNQVVLCISSVCVALDDCYKQKTMDLRVKLSISLALKEDWVFLIYSALLLEFLYINILLITLFLFFLCFSWKHGVMH